MRKMIIASILIIPNFVRAQLSNESELGIASANGNTKIQTYNIKQSNDYKWDINVISFRSRYLNSKANNDETARYFIGGLKYERQSFSYLGWFFGETFEKDKFANIDRRLITDLGGKYRFINSDKDKLLTEIGYRYMNENRIDDTSVYSHYARIYGEWESKWNNNFSTKYWAEYLPNMTEMKDWQINTELSISAVITSLFNLKSGILLRYDHYPATNVLYKTDTLFTTSLVAKF